MSSLSFLHSTLLAGNPLDDYFKDVPEIAPMMPAADYPDPVFDMEYVISGAADRDNRARTLYAGRYGYVLLSAETMEALAALCAGRRILDAGSGLGYIAAQLSGRGIEVTAIDCEDPRALPPPFPVPHVWQLDAVGDASAALPGDYDVVLLAWPPHRDRMALNVARAMCSGQILIYEGEDSGGCNATGGFFRYLDSADWEELNDETDRLNAHHVTFARINDYWRVLRKR